MASQAASYKGASYIARGAPGDAGVASCRSRHTADGLAEETKASGATRAMFNDGSSLAQLLSENMGFCLVSMTAPPQDVPTPGPTTTPAST